MFRQKGDLQHFKEMLHNFCFVVPKYAHDFIILFFVFKEYVFLKPRAKIIFLQKPEMQTSRNV